MYKTTVTKSLPGKLKNPNMTDVISAPYEISGTGSNRTELVNKVMFAGLSITSMVIFYLAIASLML